MTESSIEHARDMRARKAALFRALSTGDITLEAILMARPATLKTTTLWDTLNAGHNMGPTGVAKVCKEAGVDTHTLVGDLTCKQARAVNDALPARAR